MGTIQLLYSEIPDLLPQSRGVDLPHLTDIIRAVGVKYGYMKPYNDVKDEHGRPIFSEETRSRMQLGLTLEYALLQRLNAHDRQTTGRDYDRYIAVGELESDGILMNLDFHDVIVGEPVECKLTWRSSASDKSAHIPLAVRQLTHVSSTTFWKDWTQAACYARRMGSLSASLALCHVDGDYTFPKSVHFNMWRQTWEQDELDDIWTMIVKHKHLATPHS